MRTNRRAAAIFLRIVPLGLLIACGERGWAAPEENTPAPGVQAMIYLSPTPPSILEDRKVDVVEFARFKGVQAQSLRLRAVLQDAIDDLGRDPDIKQEFASHKADDFVDWLASNLLVDFPEEGEFMRVRFKSGSPANQARVINAVVTSYFKLIVENLKLDVLIRRDQYKQKLDLICGQIQDVYQQIATESEKATVAIDGQLPFEVRLAQCEALELTKVRVSVDSRLAQAQGCLAQEAAGTPEHKELKKSIAAIELERTLLQKRLAEVDPLASRSGAATSLIMRLRMLSDAFQVVASRLQEKLLLYNIEADAPPRVRLVEPAKSAKTKAPAK